MEILQMPLQISAFKMYTTPNVYKQPLPGAEAAAAKMTSPRGVPLASSAQSGPQKAEKPVEVAGEITTLI